MLKNSNSALSSHKQYGATLIFFALLLLMVGTAAFFTYFDAAQYKQKQDRTTAEALAIAKAALIGRGVTDNERPGSLPCPDTNNDGSADLFKGNACPAYIGRWPWKTMATEDLRDGYGERLWYAISSNMRDHPVVQPVNLTKVGQISLDGNGDYVAIIFSAGPPFNGQSRPSNQVTDYLEGENANGDDAYTSQRGEALNDHLLGLTKTELMEKVALRILREIAGNDTYGLRFYYSKAGENMYPYADSNHDGYADNEIFTGTPSYQGHGQKSIFFATVLKEMLINNGWLESTIYVVSNDRKQVSLSLGKSALEVRP